MEIQFQERTTLKQKPDSNNLGFGNEFTDYMFIMNYEEGKDWFDPRIVPYEKIQLDPSAMVFHYAQADFEGMKAYRAPDGNINLFRPEMNMKRLNESNERLCIPKFDEQFVLGAIEQLVGVEKDWIPNAPNTALYIRPFIIATDPFLGVRPSNTYLLMVILSPVGAYYKEGINPVNIYVETEYVRAVRGGVGTAKASGNYAASIKAQMEAKAKGFAQVLWLDAIERKYVEEVGTMNIFFNINGTIVTPALSGSILPGITRDSVITYLRSEGYTVEERKLSIDEVFEASHNGTLLEVFGTGTAAVISPVGKLSYKDKIIEVNNNKMGDVCTEIYETITGMQNGTVDDRFNWITTFDQSPHKKLTFA